MTKDKFLYFAYGSNLLGRRIHINMPSAVRAGIGKLQDHRLSFHTYSKTWKGAAATIVPKKGEHVWGALWEIDTKHMEYLDRQEAVHINFYFAKTVEVISPNGEKKIARTYEICKHNPSDVADLDKLPIERRPSHSYIETIKEGALESCLPQDYRAIFDKVVHHGTGIDVINNLNRITEDSEE